MDSLDSLSKIICNFIKCGNKQKVEEKLYYVLKNLKDIKKRLSILFLLDEMVNKLMLPFVLQESMNKRNKKKYPINLRFKKKIRLALKSFCKSVMLRSSLYILEQKFLKEFKSIFQDQSFSQRKNQKIIFYFLDQKALFTRQRFLKKRRRVKFY